MLPTDTDERDRPRGSDVKCLDVSVAISPNAYIVADGRIGNRPSAGRGALGI
jgi:hypothetical protein